MGGRVLRRQLLCVGLREKKSGERMAERQKRESKTYENQTKREPARRLEIRERRGKTEVEKRKL